MNLVRFSGASCITSFRSSLTCPQRSAITLYTALLRQPEVNLMNKSRALQRMIRPLGLNIVSGESPQLLVNR